MPETRENPLQRAAAPAYRRIDRDLRTATEAVRPMLLVIRSKMFEKGFNVNRIRAALDLRSTKDTARFLKSVGVPLPRYVEGRRIETSCRLLLDTDMELAEIASRVGYRRYKTWREAFRRRMGCLPKIYRRKGGLPGRQAAAVTEPERASAPAEPGVPRYVAGIAELRIDSFCARCDGSLEPGPVARVFENLEPLCDLCALEHAPRELAEFLFVNAPHRKRLPKERLDRIAEPEKILAGFQRQLSRDDADLLIWALLCRYPASAGVVGEIFGRQEKERRRRLELSG